MVLDKVFSGNKKEAVETINKIYKEKGYAIVNFLYFANIPFLNLFGSNDSKTQKEKQYAKSLENTDVILPDGIAFQIFYKTQYKKKLDNLNGTDFTPYFLSKFKSKDLNLVFFGAKEDIIKKAQKNFEEYYGIKVKKAYDGYNEFDFSVFEGVTGYNILLVGLGTPLQEIRILENMENIKKYNIMVFGVGGLFDFLGGAEKRAPYMIRKAKLEWFYRLLTNPKKNFKKVYYSLFLPYFMLKKIKN